MWELWARILKKLSDHPSSSKWKRSRQLGNCMQPYHILLKTLKSRTLSLLKMSGKEGSSSKIRHWKWQLLLDLGGQYWREVHTLFLSCGHIPLQAAMAIKKKRKQRSFLQSLIKNTGPPRVGTLMHKVRPLVSNESLQSEDSTGFKLQIRTWRRGLFWKFRSQCASLCEPSEAKTENTGPEIGTWISRTAPFSRSLPYTYSLVAL